MEYHYISSKVSIISVPKNFVWETFVILNSFGFRKNFSTRVVYNDFPSIFWNHSAVPKKLRRRDLCFRKFLRSKSLGITRRNGWSITIFPIFRRNIVFRSTKKLSIGALQCFTKFLVPEKFLNKIGVSRFCVEVRFDAVSKNFVSKPFCVSQSFWNRKI